MKTIIVACGGGIATSATVASKINDRLADRGLSSKAKCEAVDIKSLDTFMSTADLYVSITPTPGGTGDFSIPVVSGMPFLIGVGDEAALDKIIEILGL